MRLFFSAGDPSGDIHTARVLRAIRRLNPQTTFFGLGGPAMEAAGCDLLYRLVDRPVIGVLEAVRSVPFFWGLYQRVRDVLRTTRPDAVVLVDYPGFNWWVARAARAAGVPVLYFLAPQLWAWGSWRVRKMRRLVDRVLCAYPFEEPWYRQRGVDARYVGHPYFDELANVQPLAPPAPGVRRVVLLPGSRGSEVRRMTRPMIRTAAAVRKRVADVEFVAACRTAEHAAWVRAQARKAGVPLQCVVGQTPQAIASAHCCVAKSGSITMELLWFAKPAVIYYRVPRAEYGIYRFGLATGIARVRYISLPNIAAGRMVYPELVSWAEATDWMLAHLIPWLTDPAAHDAICREIRRIRALFARRGATMATAREILEFAGRRAAGRLAA